MRYDTNTSQKLRAKARPLFGRGPTFYRITLSLLVCFHLHCIIATGHMTVIYHLFTCLQMIISPQLVFKCFLLQSCLYMCFPWICKKYNLPIYLKYALKLIKKFSFIYFPFHSLSPYNGIEHTSLFFLKAILLSFIVYGLLTLLILNHTFNLVKLLGNCFETSLDFYVPQFC